jgi:hypothetical protein
MSDYHLREATTDLQKEETPEQVLSIILLCRQYQTTGANFGLLSSVIILKYC